MGKIGHKPPHTGKTKKEFPNLSNAGRKKGCIPWNKGKKNPKLSERNKINNPMNNEATRKKASDTRKRNFLNGKIGIQREERYCACGCGEVFICKINSNRNFISGHNSRCRSEETIEKMRQASIRRIQLGLAKPSWTNCKTGKFYSTKNKKYIYYMSSYELLAFQLLESMVTVRKYEVGTIKIPYKYIGKKHYYIVDLFVEYVNGEKQLIEIKPVYMLKDNKVRAKLKAGKEFAKGENMKFKIWTEKLLVDRVEV